MIKRRQCGSVPNTQWFSIIVKFVDVLKGDLTI